jgi:hypothetical protein
MGSKSEIEEAYSLIDNEVIKIKNEWPKRNKGDDTKDEIAVHSLIYQLQRAMALLKYSVELIDKFNG